MIEIDIIAWLIASVAGYALGAVWFSPAVFGTAWMNALGKTQDQLGSPARAMLWTLLSTLLSGFVLCSLLVILKISSLIAALALSSVTAIGFYGLSVWSDGLFCGWSYKLMTIQSGYRVSMFVLIGLVYTLIAA